jgi:hypothetical protein
MGHMDFNRPNNCDNSNNNNRIGYTGNSKRIGVRRFGINELVAVLFGGSAHLGA